jgi:hypothetical protein
MKAYLITTGIIFGLITAAHVLRVFAEGVAMAKDPFFILLTALAAGMCVWDWRLFWKLSRA